MPTLISKPTTIQAAGEPPKQIDEYIGRVNSGTASVSVAYMRSPQGWAEPAQQPDFDEFTVVLRGALRVEHDGGTTEVEAGQGIIVRTGERVRYSTPNGAEYIAVCAPAFAPELVHREAG